MRKELGMARLISIKIFSCHRWCIFIAASTFGPLNYAVMQLCARTFVLQGILLTKSERQRMMGGNIPKIGLRGQFQRGSWRPHTMERLLLTRTAAAQQESQITNLICSPIHAILQSEQGHAVANGRFDYLCNLLQKKSLLLEVISLHQARGRLGF